MENFKMTNALLYHYEQELQQIKGSIFAILLKGRIQEFYKNNGIRIQSLYERIAKLQREHFAVDEKDNIVHTGKEGQKIPVLLEGKTMDGFKMNYELIMKESVTII